MRKNYIYLVLLLLLHISMFAQKVTLTPTVVNGANFSAGPINLASVPYSTISLGVKVEMPATAAPGDNGTIKIYYSKGAALGANVAISGDGGTLYFGGGNVAVKSFVINLNWNDFLTSGGFIFAEYRSGASYVSSNIPVIKNTTMTGGTTLNPPADAPNPSNIANTLCCNQTIRQGDKPASISGSQYLNPYQGLPYGINSKWSVANGTTINLDDTNKILDIDYATELKNLTVTRELGYNYGGQFPNKSNTITITVVPSPIISNQISVDVSVNNDGFAELIKSNPKQISGDESYVNLNILQNPFHIPGRSEAVQKIDKYEWEYAITNKALGGKYLWTTIPNQNSVSLNSSYLPDPIGSEEGYYLLRRIAFYNNIKRASNPLKIVLRTNRLNNTICCDQILQVSTSNEIEKPVSITGPIAISDQNQYLFYQWQSQSIINRGKPSNWADITGATSKDYLPLPLEFIPGEGRNEPTIPQYNYRRIATTNIFNGETYYSNEISLTSSKTQQTPTSTIIVYPNPASSVINIENKDITYNLTDNQITIVNITGTIVNAQLTVVNPNLISANISSLALGTYFINIQIFRNGRRITLDQITFIKQ